MDRSSLKRFLIACCAIALPLAALAQNHAPMQNGEWALRKGRPQILSQLQVHTSKSGTQLDILQYDHAHRAIERYVQNEQHDMHLVLVRDDFREFSHLRPQREGVRFTAGVALASGHRYYVYADSYPAGIGQQVFRFTVTEGVTPQTRQTGVAASSPTALVGPYTVRISTTRLIAHKPTTLYLHFNKGGTPATDIQPYLGAAAHAVVVNTSNLTYLHIDPSLVSSSVPSEVQVVLPPIGTHAAYKFWLQFNGAGTIYTAPFTLVAK